ncbi:MAG: monovalent cation/H(+) antiporter subunit G [Alphaproteobacteria bacterium]
MMSMDLFLPYLSGFSLAIGTLALVIGSLGLIRLPDVFSRIHAVGMMDTAGVGFIVLGMMIHEGFSLISVKLAAVAVFLFFTSPIATHAVAQVAHKSGFSPVATGAATSAKKVARKKPAKAKAGTKATPKAKTAGKAQTSKTVTVKKAAKKAPKKATKKSTGRKGDVS